jgi:hypothetical protein
MVLGAFHPQYSHDPTYWDFILSADEESLKGCNFKDAEEIYIASKTALQEFMCDGIQKCLKQL